MQTVPPPVAHRPRRAATAAQVRRRHFALLLLLVVGAGFLLSGVLMLARFVAPWGNLKWLLGEPRFLDRPRHVLVVGVDRESRGARGELFMVLRLDTRYPAVTAISFPVETQTTIPGYGVGKLKDVPAVGGGPLARQTVETLLGITLDRAVVLDPAGAQTFVHSLGGVELLVPAVLNFRDSVTGESMALAAGMRRLDGKEAVAFGRLRSSDAGDLKRIARQQSLASALMRQAQRSPWNLPEATKTLVKVAGGDLKQQETEEVVRFLQSKPPTRFTTIPGNPGYGGAWIPNPGRISALLDRLDKAKERPSSRTPMAEIRFTMAREKAAINLANALVDRGVTVVRTAPLDEEDSTLVVTREPSGRVDNIVRTLLPAAPWVLSDDPSPYSADYTIVVGRDAPDGR